MSQEIPEIEESTKFNFITSIWIVPFIALLIAGWLAYQYYSELGPQIRITFPKNEGLQAGQSHIKYRDVPVGVINKIELQENGEGVVVVARMDRSVTPYLNENSKFWIVKPEVGVSGISGLDTLISGTYINMFAQKNGNYKENFAGLDHAYRNIGGGEYFVLNTPRGDSSVKVGTPIYLKNVKVGQVEYVVLALDDASVDVIVFIDKRYVPYIHTDSKFWVRSTLDAGLQNGNLDITVAPVTDLIQGAIEFSTTGKESKRTVPNSFVFELYKNKNIIEGKKVGYGGKYIKTFMLHTEGSLAKLKENAAVRYEGFEVGKVKKISLSYERSTHKMRGKVLVDIDTSVFKDKNDTQHTGEENLYQAVKEGLRAQIVPTDIITGMLYVDLVFDRNDTTGVITKEGRYASLPTVGYSSGNIMASATKILDKINRLPLEKLLASLNKVVDESAKPVANANAVLIDLKKTVANLNKMTNKRSFSAMPDEVNRMLKELTRTLQTTKKVVKGYDSNSLITKQLSQTLKIVTETSKEMQQFLEMLNRKPNSLIFGDH
ncbi:Paraquat-inducible protein B [hydrothermal vent metagenome]|uniref:Paraquat-inducible protein B n=1 Tax=hydrothermal vent metagenome TaxID=652676 RepID=A0A1W1BGK5_9ZZZZ